MSTTESQRKPSQSKQGNDKQGNAAQPRGQHSDDVRTPLPFDDDDGTGTGDVVQTTPPQGPID